MKARMNYLEARIAMYRKMLREPRATHSYQYYARQISESEDELCRLRKAACSEGPPS
jgi:hypothetical protein